MRRHTPTLYTLSENSSHSAGGDDDGKLGDMDDPHRNIYHWDVKPRTYPQSPSVSTTRSLRVKTRQESNSSDTKSNPTQIPTYPDIYAQFVKRYRSSELGQHDDPRD